MMADVAAPMIFMHLPKTAGTSFRAWLAARFEPGALLLAYGNELSVAHGTPAGIGPLREGLAAGASAVIGHFGWGARELLGVPRARYGTLLRDPVEKAVSFYRHCARTPSSRHYGPIGRGMTLRTMILEHRAPELNNHYVRSLLGDDRWMLSRWPPAPGAEATPIDQLLDHGHLSVAWQRLTTDFFWVGRTEKYDESLRRLSAICGWSYVAPAEKLNTAPPSQTAGAEPDPETRAVITRYNALDIELCQRAAERWG